MARFRLPFSNPRAWEERGGDGEARPGLRSWVKILAETDLHYKKVNSTILQILLQHIKYLSFFTKRKDPQIYGAVAPIHQSLQECKCQIISCHVSCLPCE
jgi:hypothetical protein